MSNLFPLNMGISNKAYRLHYSFKISIQYNLLLCWSPETKFHPRWQPPCENVSWSRTRTLGSFPGILEKMVFTTLIRWLPRTANTTTNISRGPMRFWRIQQNLRFAWVSLSVGCSRWAIIWVIAVNFLSECCECDCYWGRPSECIATRI